MDTLFVLGALVIGLRAGFVRGAGIALLQLLSYSMLVVWRFSHATVVPILFVVMLATAVGLGLVTYIGGLKLPKDHAHRETCELLGAASVSGMLVLVASFVIAVVA